MSIDSDAPPQKQEVKLNCPRCGSLMELKEATYGLYYGCTRFPHCKTKIDADSFGRPQAPNKELANLREKTRRKFNCLWKSDNAPMTREEAYDFISEVLVVGPSECYIGQMSEKDCKLLCRTVDRYFRMQRRKKEGLPPVSKRKALILSKIANKGGLVRALADSIVHLYGQIPENHESEEKNEHK